MKKILILILIPAVFFMSGCSKMLHHNHTSCHSFIVEELFFDTIINRINIWDFSEHLGKHYKNRKQLFSAVDRIFKKDGASTKAKDINFFTIGKNECKAVFPKFTLSGSSFRGFSYRYTYKVERNQDNKKYIFVKVHP